MKPLVVTIVLTILVAAAPAMAQVNVNTIRPPIRMYPYIDVPLTLTSAAFYLFPAVIHDPLPPDDCFPCDPDSVNPLDRTVIDFHSTSAATASDALMIAMPIAAAGMSLVNLAAPQGGGTALAQDLLLMAESVMVTGMITTFVKRSVHRARPFMYTADPPDDYRKYDERDYASFFSGHSSLAFAIATSFSTLYTIRHPHGQGRIWVWIVSMSTATATALLRVFAGKHFWTDVATGAVFGSAIGVTVPLLHRAPRQDTTLTAGPTSLQLNIRF